MNATPATAARDTPMSIETVGPAGYDFQYAATLLLALTHVDREDAQVVMEPRQGEDFTLVLGAASGTPLTVEAQVKSSAADVDLATLADWLLHYPPGIAERPLATRVAEDPQRLALFLAGGRCTDDLRRLLVRVGVPLTAHEQSGFGIDQLARVREALCGPGAATSAAPATLDERRAAHRASIVWKRHNLLALSHRVLVVEQLTPERIAREVEAALRKMRIPASRVDDLARALVDEVRKARDQRADCMPAIRRVVRENAEPRLIDFRDHVPRAEEESLEGELRGFGVLLLTGQGQCGKTHLAEALAQRYQDEGHHVLVAGDIDEAARFLRRDDPEDRVCVLDDPLPAPPAVAAAWRKLETLVARRAPHRRLVVTCRSESLRVARGPNPATWTLSGIGWHDLTLRQPAEAVRFWEAFAAAAGVPEQGRARFREHLQRMDGAILLQPGQLRYLALNPPGGTTASDWETAARFDARDLAVEIAASAAWRPFAALGLSATHLRAVTREHLAFLLSDAEERPGLEEEGESGKIYAYGGHAPPPPPFPSYARAYALDASAADAVDALEQRGILACSAGGVAFAHPDFQEAARMLLRDQPAGRTEWILGAAERAIGSLATGAASNAVRVLRALHAASTDHASRERIIELLRSSQRSIFPEVRDAGLRVLLELLPDVGEAVREDVLKRCERFYADAEEILWHDGRPWLNPHEDIDGWRSFLADLAPPPAGSPPVPDQLVTPEQAWKALRHARDAVILGRGLQFDEVFIRRRAAERLFAVDPCATEALVRQVLADEPAVVAGALESALQEWPSYAPKCRTLVTELFAEAVAREPVAIAVAPILWRFYHRLPHDGGDGPADLWRLWGALFPAVIDAAPPYAWAVDDEKLGYVANEALPFLDDNTAWRVANAWQRWIERTLVRETPRGDALDVAMYVLRHTGADSARRPGWIARLVGSRNTALSAVTLTTCLASWDELGANERDDVLRALGSDRSDAAWLQAAALTSRSVPPEVVRLVTGDPEALGRSGEDLRRAIPEPVLRKCIWIQTGRSSLFGWLGLGSGSGGAPWAGVLAAVRGDPTAPEFDDAWADELEDPEEGRSLAQFSGLFETGTPELRSRLFRHLLKSTARVVSSRTRAYWNSVWDLASEEERTAYAREAMRSAERLSSNNDELEPFRDGRFLGAFLKEVPRDHLVFQIARLAREVGLAPARETEDESAREARASVGKLLATVAEQGEFRTLWALDLAEVLAKNSGDAEAERAVGDARKHFFDRLKRDEARSDDEFLRDWVFTRER